MPRLSFKGKVFVENHHLAVPFHELLPERDKGLNERASLHDNLIVHGDNLAALKSLLPTYHSKVKCIYIDPPYNTGKEGWAYSDKVNSPFMQDWLGHVVDRDDLTRHDKWLCMMLPRLKLLCELLREDGVIFVSIDDNEVHHLRCLMAEVFGEENFIACLPTVMNRKGNNDEFGFSGTHEYTLCWAKDISQAEIGEFPLADEELEDWKEDEFGYWKQGANLKATGINAPRNKRPNLFFPVFVDENDNLFISETNHRDLPGYISVFPVSGNDEMSWRWSKEKFRQDAHDVIISRLGNSISLYKKQRPKAGDLPSRKPKSLLEEPAYSSGNGTAMMKSIFGEKVFDYPKPTKLIMDLLSLATNEDSIVLDSFAGSGTTAQAVLALNRGGGSRRFILIECEDYADSITAERVRRVINGVPTAKDNDLREGLGGTFSYFKLGLPMCQESLLDGSHLPEWEKLASYIFFTATGQEFDPAAINRATGFIGSTQSHDVFLFYEPDVNKLKSLALSLHVARALPEGQKRKLVFAPTKYLDTEFLHEYRIDFQQLPFQIYKAIERLES